MPCTGAGGIGLDAQRTELNYAITKATGLALHGQESSLALYDKVVALIDSKRQQNPIPTPDKLRQDRSLAPVTDINRMIAKVWLR